MNILIIPSWYPNETEPNSGVFVKEQAEALAEFFPEHNFIVSNAGDFGLSVKDLNSSVKTIGRFIKSESSVININKNLCELYNPALTWTRKLGGGEKNLLKIHTENFLKAKELFGKIDIMHAHVSYPGGFAANKIKEEFSIPYIITEHMGPFPFDSFLKNGKLSKKISLPLQNADRIIAVSNYLSDRISSFGITGSVVIPNMVNEQKFFPINKKNVDTKIQFLTVASFIESKGIEELMKGILLAKEKNNNVEFIIAGNGHLENFIENFIFEKELSGMVRLVKKPVREEIINLFKECDVFLLPSRLESFGVVFIEAMACGKAVIATDCGGPSDFVKDFNGKLIPVNDPSAISEEISFFKKNLSGYSSEKIREFVLENFSRKVVCDKIIQQYKSVLQQAGK